jgi:hypothetical protein
MTEPPETPPAWPFGTPTDAEAALWADVWSRPPASLWERFGLARDVATYVRTALGFEREGHTNAALGGLRPIPEGRAAPFRRPAAAGTLDRLWSGCPVPQDGLG